MIALTAPDGLTVAIDESLVVRARMSIAGETRDKSVKTRIDWVDMQLVKEPIEDVSSAVVRELKTFTSVTSRNGTKIWFNGEKAVGPISITGQNDGVVKSAIKLMGYRQYVIETPDEVRSILRASGGVVLP